MGKGIKLGPLRVLPGGFGYPPWRMTDHWENHCPKSAIARKECKGVMEKVCVRKYSSKL